MPQVRLVTLFDNLQLGPGQAGEWFTDNVSQNAGRWFTAIPVSPGNPEFFPLPDNDQLIEITDVTHTLKGASHGRDGSGGTGTVQAKIRVENLDPINPVTFRVYMAEAE